MKLLEGIKHFDFFFFVKTCGGELTGLLNIFLVTFTGTIIKSTKMWKALDGRDFSCQFSSLPYQTWLKICWLYMWPTNSFKKAKSQKSYFQKNKDRRHRPNLALLSNLKKIFFFKIIVSFMSYSTRVELKNCHRTLFTIFWLGISYRGNPNRKVDPCPKKPSSHFYYDMLPKQ